MEHKVVNIVITGGPCAGKQLQLPHPYNTIVGKSLEMTIISSNLQNFL